MMAAFNGGCGLFPVGQTQTPKLTGAFYPPASSRLTVSNSQWVVVETEADIEGWCATHSKTCCSTPASSAGWLLVCNYSDGWSDSPARTRVPPARLRRSSALEDSSGAPGCLVSVCGRGSGLSYRPHWDCWRCLRTLHIWLKDCPQREQL